MLVKNVQSPGILTSLHAIPEDLFMDIRPGYVVQAGWYFFPGTRVQGLGIENGA